MEERKVHNVIVISYFGIVTSPMSLSHDLWYARNNIRIMINALSITKERHMQLTIPRFLLIFLQIQVVG